MGEERIEDKTVHLTPVDVQIISIMYESHKRKEKGYNCYQLNKEFGISLRTAYKSTRKLEQMDLLRSKTEDGKRRYRLNPQKWACVNGTFISFTPPPNKMIINCSFYDTCTNDEHLSENCNLLKKFPNLKELTK